MWPRALCSMGVALDSGQLIFQKFAASQHGIQWQDATRGQAGYTPFSNGCWPLFSSFTSPHKFHFLEHGARWKCKSIRAKISKNKSYPSWIFLCQQGWFLTPHWRSNPESSCKLKCGFHIYQLYQATWLMPWLHMVTSWYIDVARCCKVGESMYHVPCNINPRRSGRWGEVVAAWEQCRHLRDQSVGWVGEVSTVSDPSGDPCFFMKIAWLKKNWQRNSNSVVAYEACSRVSKLWTSILFSEVGSNPKGTHR